MADALTYIATRWNLTLSSRRMPLELPDANRVTLAQLFHVLEFHSGAEIGVECGLYSEVLCRENPGVRLLCVDAWQKYRDYRDHVSQAKLEGFAIEAAARLAPYPRATLVRQFSVEAARDVPDGSLDFVYIDANHRLERVIADLAAWAPKVRVGGIVAGHDYLKGVLPSLMHVPQALAAWTDCYDIAPWFVLGRKAKIAGELRDDGRSWCYVQAAPATRAGKIHQ